MSPTARTVLALLAITTAGMVLCTLLIFGTLDRLRLRAAEANVDFVLAQLRDAIEANVSLGIPLDDIRIIQDLIERARAGDPQIVAVEVFSPAGISLFNTDRGSIGESITQPWREAIRFRVENDRFRVEEPGGLVVGQVILNDFSEPVGYVAVTITGTARQQHAGAVMGVLAERTAGLLPFALVIVGLAGALLLGIQSRDLKEVAARLRGERPQPTVAPPADAPDLPARADAVRATVTRAVTDLDRATEAVLRLDQDDGRDAAA